jgi:hypothetical protein
MGAMEKYSRVEDEIEISMLKIDQNLGVGVSAIVVMR